MRLASASAQECACYNCLHEDQEVKKKRVEAGDKLTFQHVLVRQWSMAATATSSEKQ